MTRSLIILLSLLLVLSPVTATYAAQSGHSTVTQNDSLSAVAESNDMSDCMQTSQAENGKSCCQDSQCKQHCQTMHCSSFGKLSALSININAESDFITLSRTHAGLFHAPGSGIINTPHRPPILQL